MKNRSLFVFLPLLLASCATPFRAPQEVAHLILERADSPSVRVTKVWLERRDGALVLAGLVNRRVEADDTRQTHLDVTIYDAAGRVLRTEVARFTPGDIELRPRQIPQASYAVKLEALPAQAARIEVRAHDGAHAS